MDWNDGHVFVLELEWSRSERCYEQGNCECYSFHRRLLKAAKSLTSGYLTNNMLNTGEEK